jgi:HNH endonuclease
VSREAREYDWGAIASYYAAGHTVRECRERFGFSGHAWSAAVERGHVQPRQGQNGRPRGETREAVRLLLEAGLTRAGIARELRVSKPTVTYHAKALGFTSDARSNRRYDWQEVQRYYDEGHSISACQLRFGFARKTFFDAAHRGAISTRPQTPPATAYLTGDRRQHRGTLKRALLRERLKSYSCERCGISEWLGLPLSLALHHMNGDGRDNRLENLQLLCPNCHSQTDNFAGRNVRPDGCADDAAPS